MILAATLMAGAKINAQVSRSQIEEKARGFGMKYPEDFKVINGEDVKKW